MKNLTKKVILLISHLLVGFIGFAAGIYALPILTAPEAPPVTEIQRMATQAKYTARFEKDLEDSDFLHQGEGEVTLSESVITFMGSISPGPDYILYLSPEFVETEADFLRLKNRMAPVGPVKTFDNFVVQVPPGTGLDAYNSVIVWCESFNQFITAAQYR